MSLKTGTGVRDISPVKPMSLFGYPHVERVSTGIHDPLLASALWVENGDRRVLMIALDLLFFDPPTAREVRGRVAAAVKIPEAGVFISCTHTHSGPVTVPILGWSRDPAAVPPDPAYLRWVGDQVVEAAVAAAGNAAPSALAWTRADARGVGGNRLSKDGVTDPECGILAVRSVATRELTAVALIYGMHPTVLHEDSTLVSSDFPHYARTHLRERFGDRLTVLYHTAPAGNQSPRYFVAGQTFAEAERLGRKLGEAASKALDELGETDWDTMPRLDAALTRVGLPRRVMREPAEALALLEEYRANYRRLQAAGAPRPEVRTAECAVFGAEGTVALAEADASGDIDRLIARYKPFEIQAVRVGGAVVVGFPGECFADYALRVKREAGCRAFVVSLVNGELQGYIVTPEALAAGGYEATNAIFKPESGEVFVGTALKMIQELMAKGNLA